MRVYRKSSIVESRPKIKTLLYVFEELLYSDTVHTNIREIM